MRDGARLGPLELKIDVEELAAEPGAGRLAFGKARERLAQRLGQRPAACRLAPVVGHVPEAGQRRRVESELTADAVDTGLYKGAKRKIGRGGRVGDAEFDVELSADLLRRHRGDRADAQRGAAVAVPDIAPGR